MTITSITPQSDWILKVVSEDGRTGLFDVRPYLKSEAFLPLKNPAAFKQVLNGGYFVEWRCGADLSADTIEAHWQEMLDADARAVAESRAPYGSPEADPGP